jgi:hypothetical protein
MLTAPGRSAAAFAAGVLANLFVLFRFLTYSQRNNQPVSTFVIFAGVCFLAGFAVTVGVNRSRLRIATWLLIGVCVSQMGVIWLDWQKDPTDHNLFPFEMIYLCVLASPAYLGAAVSGVFRKSPA